MGPYISAKWVHFIPVVASMAFSTNARYCAAESFPSLDIIPNYAHGLGWSKSGYHRWSILGCHFEQIDIAYPVMCSIPLEHGSGGAVKRPEEWTFCGYSEIQNPRKRYGLIDYQRLLVLLQMRDFDVKGVKSTLDP